MPEGGVRGDGDQEEEVLVPLRCHVGLGGGGLGHVDRAGGAAGAGAVEDRVEVGRPVAGEQQVVVRQFRQFATHAGQDEDGAQARFASFPVLLRVGAQLRWEQTGLGVVEVGGGDDEGGVDKRTVGELDAGDTALRAADGGHLRAEAELHALLAREVLEGPDDGRESAHRETHPLHEVRVTHQVVQRGGALRVRGQEHRRVGEHLPQAVVPELLLDEPRQALRDQRRQLHRTAQRRGVEEGAGVGERRVEEPVDGDAVGVPRRLQVAAQLLPRPGLE